MTTEELTFITVALVVFITNGAVVAEYYLKLLEKKRRREAE